MNQLKVSIEIPKGALVLRWVATCAAPFCDSALSINPERVREKHKLEALTRENGWARRSGLWICHKHDVHDPEELAAILQAFKFTAATGTPIAPGMFMQNGAAIALAAARAAGADMETTDEVEPAPSRDDG